MKKILLLLTFLVLHNLTVVIFAENKDSITVDKDFIKIHKIVKNGQYDKLVKQKNIKKYINNYYVYVDKFNYSAIRSETLLETACKEGNLQIVKYLINSGSIITGYEYTISIKHNNYYILKYLLNKYKIPKIKLNRLLNRVILDNKDLRYVKILLDRGADPNFSVYKNVTPLTICGRVEIAEELIKYGANVNPELNLQLKYSPLYYAIYEGRYDVAQYLIEKNANLNACAFDNGATPLMIAIRGGRITRSQYFSGENIRFANYLIKKGAMVNKKSHNGLQAIHLAFDLYKHAGYNDFKFEDFDIKSTHDDTSLREDAIDLRFELIDLLIKKGANINAATDSNVRPLHFACYCGFYPFVKYLIDNDVEVNVLTNQNKYSPLLILLSRAVQHTGFQYSDYPDDSRIVSKHIIDITKLLIDNNSDLEVVDYRFSSKMGVLHYSVLLNSVELMEMFLSNNAEINKKDNNNETPLHYAVRKQRCYMVRYLIMNGADTEIRNKKGKTPLDLAKEKKYNNIVELFHKLQ